MRPKIILFFILINFLTFSQQLTEGQYYYKYKVESLDSYTEELNFFGDNISENEVYFNFSIAENAELVDLALYKINKGRKKLDVDKNIVISTLDYKSVYSGRKKYKISIPKQCKFELHYLVKEKNSIMLDNLYKGDKLNKMYYHFEIPEDLCVTFKNIEKTYTGHFDIDSAFTIDDKDSSEYFNCIVHPKNISKEQYFSDWFSIRIKDLQHFSDLNKNLFLNKIDKSKSKLEIAKQCFEFVKKEIKYVDIENGINAIVPRDCNSVLENKYGDCKDMANLLVSMLKLFNIESYNAISCTNSKTQNFNFPSVSLANHMISIAYLDGKKYFLDATEDGCLFGDPSLQTLGTDAFIIGEKYGFVKVEQETTHQNRINLSYDFSDNDNLIIKFSVEGKLNINLFENLLIQDTSRKHFNSFFSDFLKFKINTESFIITDSISSFTFKAKLPTTFFTLIGQKKYININFLPSTNEIIKSLINYNYPIINFESEISLHFKNDIEFKFLESDEFKIKLDKNHLVVFADIPAFSNFEAFEKSSIIKKWNEIISKPLKINHV